MEKKRVGTKKQFIKHWTTVLKKRGKACDAEGYHEVIVARDGKAALAYCQLCAGIYILETIHMDGVCAACRIKHRKRCQIRTRTREG